jgi:AcrR family transcriptional regulator
MSTQEHYVSQTRAVGYPVAVPKLWNDTIESHRRDVTDAILRSTVDLVTERGLRAVTMSEVAERASIGRATLYKYFPSIEAILHAWHQQQVAHHLEELGRIASRERPAIDRLTDVLERYADVLHETHDADLVGLLHQPEHMDAAHDQLHELLVRLISLAADEGVVRPDIPPGELALFCRNSLERVGDLGSKAAVKRRVLLVGEALRGS